MNGRGYVSSGFFAFRTPLLPLDLLQDWADGCSGDAGAAARATLCERLAACVDRPDVREALFVASPALDERLDAFRAEPLAPAHDGLRHALTKYVCRMAARPTPFGLFAGTSVGTIARDTHLPLPAPGGDRRLTRLDMDYLSLLVERLASDPAVRAELRFETNTSLYDAGGHLRYAEARLQGRSRSYFLVDVEPHEPLRRALERARGGATLADVAAVLTSDDIPAEDARAFVEELVDAQLLVPCLGPVVTGEDSLGALVARLQALPAAGDVVARLQDVRAELAALDREPPSPPARYRALAARLSTLADAELSRLFQVDLSRPAPAATLAASVVDDLLDALDVLVRVAGPSRTDTLADFRRAFDQRWGEREMPLVEVLDEEIGIGFATTNDPGLDPSPLLAGLPFPGAPADGAPWPPRLARLQWKLAEAIASGAEELVLDEADVRSFGDEGPALADSIHVMATLLEPDAPGGPRAVLENAAGPSGVRLLGRFCHADAELHAHVREHLRAEQALRPGVRYFEIVHLPEGRIGNILARPVLRDLELAYLGASGAPADRTLHVSDLLVSVRDGRVVLRSRALDSEVRPRLTSAHNTSLRSVAIYRFLAALQAEGVREGVAWNWGPLGNAPRLPRVRWRRVVLARAQWNGVRTDVDALLKGEGEPLARTTAWRARRGVPRWAGLADGDNVLPVDFEQALSVEAFLDALRGREGFTLVELMPGGRPDVAEGPAGRHVQEVIVPLLRRTAPAPAPAATRGRAPDADAAWSFAPGSEWLYAKLYAGPAVADRVLREVVAPRVREACASGASDTWFFIRYGDPEHHVRLRLHGDARRLLSEVLPSLHAAVEPWRDAGLVHRVQLDTYLPEVRRYGGPRALAACETWFRHDSDAALAALAVLHGDSGLDARWRLVLRGTDRIFAALGFDPPARHALARRLAAGYGSEFRMDSALRQKLMERFRRERAAIDALLGGVTPDDAALAGAIGAQDRAHTAAAPAWQALRAAAGDGTLEVAREDLAASLAHMHANRLLRSAAREQELVIAWFLESAYASRLARARVAGGRA